MTATRQTQAAPPPDGVSLPDGEPVPPTAPGTLSFDDLRRLSYARMVRLAWLLLGSRPAAEDAVHEAFLAVHRRWRSVDDPGRYLTRTVVDRSVRAQRRPATEPQRPAEGGEPPPTGDAAVDATWDAIGRLRPDRRTVVVLRYWADMPDSEIAEILGCRLASVRSRLHRARSDLGTDVR